MKQLIRHGLIIVLLSLAAVAPAAMAQELWDLHHGGWLHEESARFLPGAYYFHKGCGYAKRGQGVSAMHAWEIAAGWAMKEAQYNLGIAYFRGDGVPADRPRGLAWLALAAGRQDAAFEASPAAAWNQATPAEHARANALWRDLRPQYADAVALPRAQARFTGELGRITGPHVGMPGHVVGWTANGVTDGATCRARMQRLADINFGALPSGHVEVGPLQPVRDDSDDTPPPRRR